MNLSNYTIEYLKKRSFLARWWREIDQPIFLTVIAIISFGMILMNTASTSVATRIGIQENYFFFKHTLFLIIAIFVIFFTSLMSRMMIKRLAIIGFIINLLMLVAVLLYCPEIKGAKRWISIFGFSYQPSELIKPFFIVVTGWILSLQYKGPFPSVIICSVIYLVVVFLLILQPDFGMVILITTIASCQAFVAGLPTIFVLIISIIAILGIIVAYFSLPHVAQRIDYFLDPNNTSYQVKKSILSFQDSGFLGKGFANGIIKQYIPDAHNDFIFSVAAEEFGSIICMVLISAFAFITIRTIILLANETDKFIQISSLGLILQFAMQAIINIGVALNLLPTKGMTLPFISYGGSATIGVAISLGIVLGLTKIRTSTENYNIATFDPHE